MQAMVQIVLIDNKRNALRISPGLRIAFMGIAPMILPSITRPSLWGLTELMTMSSVFSGV